MYVEPTKIDTIAMPIKKQPLYYKPTFLNSSVLHTHAVGLEPMTLSSTSLLQGEEVPSINISLMK